VEVSLFSTFGPCSADALSAAEGPALSFVFVAQPILAVLFRATLAPKVTKKNRAEDHGSAPAVVFALVAAGPEPAVAGRAPPRLSCGILVVAFVAAPLQGGVFGPCSADAQCLCPG
jgi:hypothetical protein